jgi:hypothetical protein
LVLLFHLSTIRNRIHPKVFVYSIYFFLSLFSYLWAVCPFFLL